MRRVRLKRATCNMWQNMVYAGQAHNMRTSCERSLVVLVNPASIPFHIWERIEQQLIRSNFGPPIFLKSFSLIIFEILPDQNFPVMPQCEHYVTKASLNVDWVPNVSLSRLAYFFFFLCVRIWRSISVIPFFFLRALIWSNFSFLFCFFGCAHLAQHYRTYNVTVLLITNKLQTY